MTIGARGRAWFVAGLLALGAVPANAASLSVHVAGVDGRPVTHAVVTAEPLSGQRIPARNPGQVLIDQKGKLFRPWVTVAPVGARLVFANHDDITHHVYSFSQARRFSFRLHAGQTHAPLLLDQSGIIVVGCNIHDWMIAYVDVTAAPYFEQTGIDGIAHLQNLPPGEWRIQLWHPGLDPGTHDYSRRVTLNVDQSLTISIKLLSALTQTGPRHPMDDAGYTDY